jgi:hypothetical protein
MTSQQTQTTGTYAPATHTNTLLRTNKQNPTNDYILLGDCQMMLTSILCGMERKNMSILCGYGPAEFAVLIHELDLVLFNRERLEYLWGIFVPRDHVVHISSM